MQALIMPMFLIVGCGNLLSLSPRPIVKSNSHINNDSTLPKTGDGKGGFAQSTGSGHAEEHGNSGHSGVGPSATGASESGASGNGASGSGTGTGGAGGASGDHHQVADSGSSSTGSSGTTSEPSELQTKLMPLLEQALSALPPYAPYHLTPDLMTLDNLLKDAARELKTDSTIEKIFNDVTVALAMPQLAVTSLEDTTVYFYFVDPFNSNSVFVDPRVNDAFAKIINLMPVDIQRKKMLASEIRLLNAFKNFASLIKSLGVGFNADQTTTIDSSFADWLSMLDFTAAWVPKYSPGVKLIEFSSMGVKYDMADFDQLIMFLGKVKKLALILATYPQQPLDFLTKQKLAKVAAIVHNIITNRQRAGAIAYAQLVLLLSYADTIVDLSGSNQYDAGQRTTILLPPLFKAASILTASTNATLINQVNQKATADLANGISVTREIVKKQFHTDLETVPDAPPPTVVTETVDAILNKAKTISSVVPDLGFTTTRISAPPGDFSQLNFGDFEEYAENIGWQYNTLQFFPSLPDDDKKNLFFTLLWTVKMCKDDNYLYYTYNDVTAVKASSNPRNLSFLLWLRKNCDAILMPLKDVKWEADIMMNEEIYSKWRMVLAMSETDRRTYGFRQFYFQYKDIAPKFDRQVQSNSELIVDFFNRLNSGL